jgi:hypothetical protein
MPVISTRTNLLTNPSVETNTTGWTAVTSTLSQDNTNGAIAGTQALKVITSGSASGEGVIVGANSTLSLVPFSGQISVWAAAGVSMFIGIRFNAGGTGQVTQVFTGNGAWQTLTLNNVPSISGTTLVQLMVRTNTTIATTFWVDAAILEQAAATTSYFDGSTTSSGNTSYSWTGTAHASTSTATTVNGYQAQDFQNQVFFGTTQYMTNLRTPDAGMTARQVGYAEELQYENGGMDVYRPSSAYHMEYDFNYGLQEASGASGLNVFSDFAAGLYGSPTVYFADPMFYDVNLMPPNFAAPMLAERGWKSIGGTLTPTYSNTTSNTVGQPYRSVAFDTSTLAANTLLSQGYATVIIPIPPGMTLWLGASGSATGNAVVRVESWLAGAASPASSSNLTLLSVTGSTRLNTSVASTNANYVKLGIASSAVGAGTITLASMMAQLWPIGYTPTLTGNFQSGQGNNGLKFSSDARAEKYVLRDNQTRNVHYMGLAFTLKEVVR